MESMARWEFIISFSFFRRNLLQRGILEHFLANTFYFRMKIVSISLCFGFFFKFDISKNLQLNPWISVIVILENAPCLYG